VNTGTSLPTRSLEDVSPPILPIVVSLPHVEKKNALNALQREKSVREKTVVPLAQLVTCPTVATCAHGKDKSTVPTCGQAAFSEPQHLPSLTSHNLSSTHSSISSISTTYKISSANPPKTPAVVVCIRDGYIVKDFASTFVDVYNWLSQGKASLITNNFRPTRRPFLSPSPPLSPCGRRILDTPNAGGNSIWSEVFSCEVLRCLFGTKLERTEMEIQYGWRSKITDYSVRFQNNIIGVSVTRAMKYKGTFTADDAEYLLTKKLKGVLDSTNSVITAHSWKRQILHVWCEKEYMVPILATTYDRLDPKIRADTLVVVTIANEACRGIFYNNSSL
jgi:hypothetical protein